MTNTELKVGLAAVAVGIGAWLYSRTASASSKGGTGQPQVPDDGSDVDCSAEVDWAIALMSQADASDDPDFVGGAGDTLNDRADALSQVAHTCTVDDNGTVFPLEQWLRAKAEYYRERGLDMLQSNPEKYGYTYNWVQTQVNYAMNSQNPTVMRNVARNIRSARYVNEQTTNAALSAAVALEDAADALSGIQPGR